MARCVCLHCGTAFAAPESDNAKYCSQACYWQSKRQRIARCCEACGAAFTTTPSMLRKGPVRYCSRACWRSSNVGAGNPAWRGGVESLTCTGCGNVFDRPLTWGKRGSPYCSHACKAAHHRAHPEATPNWHNGATPVNEQARKLWRYQVWREAVYARDDYTCQMCGQRGGRLQAHHLYRFAVFPAWRYVVANGHTLCVTCHHSIKNREHEYLQTLGLPLAEPPFPPT